MCCGGFGGHNMHHKTEIATIANLHAKGDGAICSFFSENCSGSEQIAQIFEKRN